MIEEVVVTARKFEEPALEVPASLQVLSGAYLDAVDQSRLYELQFDVPGLVVNSLGVFGAGLALRGVTDQGGGSLAIAPHLNGVYLGTSNLAIGRLFDMERIEVLKGPQGTLYGRNATGGSINFVTARPQADIGFGLEAGYGSFDTRRMQGHLNVPLDVGAVRIAVVGSEGDGYVRNALDAREFGESDFHGMRVSFALDPTSRLGLDLVAQRVVDQGGAAELWSPNLAFLPDPDDIRLTSVTHPAPFLRSEADIATMNLRYDWDLAAFHSVTGLARSAVRNVDDCAGLPVLRGCVRSALPLRYEQWSQEFRLVSPDGAAARWLIGANVYDGETRSRYRFVAPLLDPDPINDSKASEEETTYAAFGEIGVPIGEGWTTTLGLRLSAEDVEVRSVGTGSADYDTLTRGHDHGTKASWRWAMEHRADPESLGYVSVTTGFKGGGITTERLPSGEFDTFDPEDLLAYEVGFKHRSQTGRWTFDAAAFLYDFRDMQVRTTTLIDDQVVSVVDNAAQARIYGLDVAGALELSDRVTVSGALVWMPEREFERFDSATAAGDLSGNDISRAPEWSASASIRYRQPVRDLGECSLMLQYSHRSEFFFTKENMASMRQPAFGLWNLHLRFDSHRGPWYLFVSGRNLADEDYFNQAFIQSSPGYPDTYETGFGLRF